MSRRQLLFTIIILICLTITAQAVHADSTGVWCAGFEPYGFDGPVVDAVVFNGDLVVAGFFASNGREICESVARWDGWRWLPMGNGIRLSTDLCEYNGELYVGGIQSDGIAKWNGTGWDFVGGGLEGGFYTFGPMVVYDGTLIVAGDFLSPWDSLGAPEFGPVIGWDGTTWRRMGDPPGKGFGLQSDFDMVVYQDDLYVTGYFTMADSETTHSLARWDGAQWSAVEGFAGGMMKEGLYQSVGSANPGQGYALAVYNDKLAIGGDFEQAGELAVSNLVIWDGTTQTWEDPGGSGGTDGWVYELASHNGELFAGGTFATIGGTPAPYFASWNASAWSSVGGGTDNIVYALEPSGTNLVVGGDFDVAGGARHGKIALWENGSYSAIQNPPGQGMEDDVLVLTEHNGLLVAGGRFLAAGDSPARRLAAWDGSAWQDIGGTNDEVLSLLSNGSDLVVAGEFTEAGGVAANYIARWDGSTWHPYAGGLPSVGRALAIHNSELYASGGTWPTLFIQRWDGSAWQPVVTDPPGSSSTVLASYGGKLVAALGNVLKTWDGVQWEAMVGTNGLGIGNGVVRTLGEWEGDLYIGGSFTIVDGISCPGTTDDANRLARWDGATLEPVCHAIPDPYAYIVDVRDITVYQDMLIVVGTRVFCLPSGATQWQLAGDPYGTVYAAQPYMGDLFVGGALSRMTGGSGQVLMNHIGRMCTGPTAVDELPVVSRFRLHPNVPNPFNPSTTIRYEVPEGGEPISLQVFDARGRLIRTLVSGFEAAGEKRVRWDARDDAGVSVASGVYFYRLEMAGRAEARKMVLVR
jgi:hypothetical protein